MDDNQNPERTAQSKEEEAFFVVRVVRVVKDDSPIIEEGGLSLLEPDAVLPLVALFLSASHSNLISSPTMQRHCNAHS